MASKITIGAELILRKGRTVGEVKSVQVARGTGYCIYYGVNQGQVCRTTSRSQEQAVLNLRRHFREKYKIEGPLDAFFVLSSQRKLIQLRQV